MNGNASAGDVRRRRIGRFQHKLSNRLRGGQCDRHTAAQRKTPDNNSIRAVSRRRESIGRRRILKQPRFGRPPAGAGVTPIGQGDEPGPVGRDASKPVDGASQEIAVAGKIQHDRMSRFGRNMPDNDLLAIRRRQKMFFSFRKAGRFRRRSLRLRNRKEQRRAAGRTVKQRAHRGSRADSESDEPFQDRSWQCTRDASMRRHIPLTIFSVIFLASPSSIMVLSR